jgi:hypothetical protein
MTNQMTAPPSDDPLGQVAIRYDYEDDFYDAITINDHDGAVLTSVAQS